MRTMYDSNVPQAIPRDAPMVLYYNDGIWAWSASERALFPDAKQVSCSAVGVAQAEVYDVEPGCIWPIEKVGPLVARDWQQGLLPTVYVNEMNHWADARAYFRRAYGREPQWMVANYDGRQTIPDGAVAKQYAHPADPPGSAPSGPWELPFHADASVVRDYWPGVDTRAPGGGGGSEDELMTDPVIREALEALVPGRAGVRPAGETYKLLVRIEEFARELKTELDFGVEGEREAGEFTGYFARRFAQIEQEQQTLSGKLDTLGSQLATLIEKMSAE